MKVLTWKSMLVAVLTFLLLWSGGGDGHSPGASAAVAKREKPQGYALSSAIWKKLQIPVCWVDPTPANANERAWVQAAIRRTWERNSQVFFSGWGKCPATNTLDGIRIGVEDSATDAPHTVGLGNQIAKRDPGMMLNFTFKNWGITCRSSETYRRSCIEVIAIHEFGHALGFAHEQNRPDTPTASCKDVKPAPKGDPIGDTMVGAWDLQSIMNYCNPKYNNDGALSPVDVATVQKYYKAPRKDSNFTFDAAFYLSIYPDLQAAFGGDQQAAENHWITHGLKEGRRASREFDVLYYLSFYPDLRQAFGSNYVAATDHWALHGIAEGRRGSREVDVLYYLAVKSHNLMVRIFFKLSGTLIVVFQNFIIRRVVV